MNFLHINAHHVLSCTGSLTYGNGVEDSGSRRAFVRGDLLRFSARLPRQLGATAALVAIRADSDGKVTALPLHWSGIDGVCDLWTGGLSADALGTGLYYLRGEVTTVAGRVLTQRTIGGDCTFAFPDDSESYPYQLTVCDFTYPAPAWIYGGAIYQVFVDRFFRGSETPVREDAILNTDWENGIPQYPAYPGAPLANNMFFGGNLDGVCTKLDYIASLGVTCIYLSPVFEAYSNHKYDTGNYMKIDDMFGGEKAFSRLLSEAKSRNIRIILDGVFNHTGDDSLYFNRGGRYPSVGAYQSKESPYYSWYDFQHFPDEYTCWWNIKILPRIHTAVPACRDYFLGRDGVIPHYAKMGVSGFRLDVADELPDEFLDGVKQRLAEVDPENILYGEVWEDASNKVAYGHRRRYFQGRQLDGVMNYELRTGIIDYVRHNSSATLRYALCEVMPNTPKRVQDAQMNLFGTHDTVRILTALAGRGVDGRSNDELAVAKMSPEERALGISRLKTAYTILATLPGVPMIYYGDEVGMEGYSDPFNRRPLPWGHMDEDVLAHFRTVGAVRRAHPLYAQGDFRLLRLDDEVLAFTRTGAGETCLTVANTGTKEKRIDLSLPYTPLIGGTVCDGQSLLLPPVSAAVLVIPMPNLGGGILTIG